MKTVTVLKVDYVCFIKHKLNWERKKVHRLLFMLWHVFHGKQLLVWNFTTKRTKCGLQLCTFLLLYITCGNVKGSCWIVRMGEGDCAASHNSIRKQLCNCLQFYWCSLWEKSYWLQKDEIHVDKCGQLLVQLPPKVTASSGHALCKCLLYKNVCILSDCPHLPNPCFYQ